MPVHLLNCFTCNNYSSQRPNYQAFRMIKLIVLKIDKRIEFYEVNKNGNLSILI